MTDLGIADVAGGYAESLILLGRSEEAQKTLEEAIALAKREE